MIQMNAKQYVECILLDGILLKKNFFFQSCFLIRVDIIDQSAYYIHIIIVHQRNVERSLQRG